MAGTPVRPGTSSTAFLAEIAKRAAPAPGPRDVEVPVQVLADRVRTLLGSAKLAPCHPSPAASTAGGETTTTPARLPPGQYLTPDFPVLSAGPTPHTPLDEWSLTIHGAVDEAVSWTWDELRALPAETFTVDIHCVTKWSKLDTTWTGVSVDTLLEGVATEAEYVTAWSDGDYTTNLPLEDITRRQGVGRLRVRRRAARSRARRPGAPARAAPVLLEEREVGARPGPDRSTTSRASGSRSATTTTATHGASSGTGATDRRAADRLAHGDRARGRRRDAARARRSCSTCPTGPGTAPASTSTCA